MAAAFADSTTVLSRIRRDLDRAALRTRNGLRHLAGVGRPEVGCTPRDVGPEAST